MAFTRALVHELAAGGGGIKLEDFFNRPALEWFK
jgi:hypothetical protein